MRRAPTHQQRGVAALAVTMTLFFAMLLVAVFANRNLVFEQRSSANQYRATQAFEAAEAGLEWAQAQLNNGQRLGADCKASADTAALSFRDRYLRKITPNAGFSAATWNNGTADVGLQPSCVRSDSGWRCACPSNGPAQPAPSNSAVPAPAFVIEFLAGGKNGVVRVVSRGCSSLAGACAPGTGGTADATARVEVALALLPALANKPAAPLTVRGSVNVPGVALGAHNADIASGGIALHSGGDIVADALRLTGPAGAPVSRAIVGNDPALASLSPDQLFTAYFGLDKASWAAQPVVKTFTCPGNCAAALETAANAAGTNALIRVGGNLQVDGPVTIGSPQQPVLIVVEGSAQLRGAVTLHGVLYAASVGWTSPVASGATVRGALVSETVYQGEATPDLVYDPVVLQALNERSGSFARISGSWRDF